MLVPWFSSGFVQGRRRRRRAGLLTSSETLGRSHGRRPPSSGPSCALPRSCRRLEGSGTPLEAAPLSEPTASRGAGPAPRTPSSASPAPSPQDVDAAAAATATPFRRHLRCVRSPSPSGDWLLAAGPEGKPSRAGRPLVVGERASERAGGLRRRFFPRLARCAPSVGRMRPQALSALLLLLLLPPQDARGTRRPGGSGPLSLATPKAIGRPRDGPAEGRRRKSPAARAPIPAR